MARLDELIKSLNVKMDSVDATVKSEPEKTVGRKRRAWLLDDNEAPTKSASTLPFSPLPVNDMTSKPSSIEREHKGITKEIQREHEGYTKGLQRDEKGITERNTKGIQTEHKEDTKGTIKGLHKGLQREHKDKGDTKGIQRGYNYFHLKGWNKKIIDLVHDICRETVSKITYPLTNATIAETLNIPAKSVKTTMQRLKLKGLLIVEDYNDGRGGWTRYSLPDKFYDDIPMTGRVQNETEKVTQRGYKGITKGATEGNTNALSSSSNVINTTTTDLTEEWNFDISPYQKFGFTSHQIKQLAKMDISARLVEESLIEFNHDLENGKLPHIKTGKLNFLMGLLRAGTPYVSEDYKDEQNKYISEMAKRAEEKKRNQLLENFRVWEDSLTPDERKKIEENLPPHLMVLNKTYGFGNDEVRNWYFNYFMDKKLG